MIVDYQGVDIRRNENLILHDVNFQVHENEFVYLTGVVGSGKSSLLETIYGELDITQGQAYVLGQDMTTIRRRQLPSLRKRMGIVVQDLRLLTDRTVRQNLDFVLRATGWFFRIEREERIKEVIQTVGLADKLDVMPYELSGGQQQLVCIARALLNQPQLILADEATGNQDTESGRHITELLHSLCKDGTAVVMATHNNQLIGQYPGTVYVCRDGEFFREGEEPDDIPVATLAAEEASAEEASTQE